MQVDIIVCGQEKLLKSMMRENNISEEHISFANATETIDFEEDPVLAIRTKKDSSMVVGLSCWPKTRETPSYRRAAPSPAYRRNSPGKAIKGVKRAALAPLIPTARGFFHADRLGANVNQLPNICSVRRYGQRLWKRYRALPIPAWGLSISEPRTQRNQSAKRGFFPFEKIISAFLRKY
jgi:glycerol-3-phosphate acyltransferase PlsX